MKTLSLFLLFSLVSLPVLAKKVMVYDEKEGITWVEEGAQKTKKSSKKGFEAPTIHKTEVVIEEKNVSLREHVKLKPASGADYIKTGMKFYYDKDYSEALGYFTKAWESKKKPTYHFYMGAALSKLQRNDEMVVIFEEIRRDAPKDSAADDATFYLAVYRQSQNDYAKAHELYKEVVELYPEGTSLIGGMVFREAARQQLRAMKIDILSRLKILDYKDDNALELLKQFQNDYSLPATGSPDRETVARLIRESDNREKNIKERLSEFSTGVNRRLPWYLLVSMFLLANIFWGIRNLRAAADVARRAALLQRVTE
ncbi:MAG: hypothetical protein A2293_09735 [Elusimicrobia bacterium RIFOXYB2_FULL_49_7]|nr:MAG: hypothetical protein A2293_09735 [Elusimicrobia bacterium RIFOXYB2_FULL_49_7]